MTDSMTLIEYMAKVGSIHKFYGVDGSTFKLDDMVFEVVENPDDGYRSYMDTINLLSDTGKLVFFKRMLDRVAVIYDNNNNGYNLVSTKDGHVWLRVGTDYSDDYYPYFIFDYTPRAPK